MERPTCKTCPHWERESVWDCEENEDGNTKERCKCLRYPPQAMPKSIMTWSNEGCGEHPDFPAYITSLKEEKDARDPRKTVKQRFEPPMGRQP